MDSSEETYLGLLRHGQTVWNLEKRIQGRMDSPLTNDGIHRCRKWARHLASPAWSWDRIITSPLPRARKTAEYINENLTIPMAVDDGLREQDWGLWEGLTIGEVKKNFPNQLEQQVSLGWSFCPPQGESRLEVSERVTGALAALVKKHPGEQLLIITHQGVIKSLIYRIENRQFLPEEKELINSNRLHTITGNSGVFSGATYNIALTEQQ